MTTKLHAVTVSCEFTNFFVTEFRLGYKHDIHTNKRIRVWRYWQTIQTFPRTDSTGRMVNEIGGVTQWAKAYAEKKNWWWIPRLQADTPFQDTIDELFGRKDHKEPRQWASRI